MNNKKIKILRSKIDKIDKSLYDLIQKRAHQLGYHINIKDYDLFQT